MTTKIFTKKQILENKKQKAINLLKELYSKDKINYTTYKHNLFYINNYIK